MWIYSRKQLNRIVKKATKKVIKENKKLVKEYERRLMEKELQIYELEKKISLIKLENKLDNWIYIMKNFYLKKHECNDNYGGKN